MGVINYFGRSLLLPVAFFLIGGALGSSALAGEYTVSPVRIYMTPKDRAVAVTVTNDGDSEIVLQAELYQWKQATDGKDELTPTDDLFLSPPILKIAPKSRQVVRLARVHSAKPIEQLTYRMIMREVLEARKPVEGAEVQIALAFNMPVFITPLEAKPKLECTVSRVSADVVTAVCANSGKAHTHPVNLELKDGSGQLLARDDIGGYILASITRNFELKRKDGKIPAGSAILAVSFADGTAQKYDVGIAP